MLIEGSVEWEELRELLNKNWMTHDAMWFFHTLERHGIEEANILNRAACRSMAAIEAKRLQKLLGIEEIKRFEDLQRFVSEAFDLIKADFMDFSVAFPSEDEMTWDAPGCFAYDGVSRLGVLEGYQCGIFERLEGWLDALGVEYQASPPVDGCLRRDGGSCRRRYRFGFSH